MPEAFVDPHPLLLALFIVFAFCFILQMAFLWGILFRLKKGKDAVLPEEEPGVSVVICAHNEYLNLQEKLPLILAQDYPEFEVIVVNHASDDDTGFLLTGLSDHYPQLKIVDIQADRNFFTGKKFPLSIGIKSAKYDKVLLTDADCRPAGIQWIRSMASAFRDKKEIVLGYGAYEKLPGFLNKMIRFDVATIAMQYLSYALSGIPYMGVGRNLAYRKSLFYRSNGFISHYRIRSGDDDLFINRVARKRNTTVMLNPDAFTFSNPKRTLGKWITQKKRHFSTATYYRPVHKFLLGLWSLTQALFWASLVALLSLQFAWIFVLGILGLMLVSRYVVYGRWLCRLQEKDLVWLLPVLELLMLLLNGGILLSNLVKKPARWK
jgi:cellulose synthase/poly-beta-1,6-N-acetylglucosamine synthase-like glycosyltransferase